jgi:dTMP kinase
MSEALIRGRLIVLEGIDGSGTTTQTERLVEHLRRRGRTAVSTREPSAGPIGRLLREVLLGHHRISRDVSLDGQTMAMLFAADRFDHLQREVEPLLAAGNDVVSDRYLMSSLAYQAEEADREWVALLARGVRPPDLTILLDIPIEVAARRRLLAGRPEERYDADSYLSRVADNYRRLARADASAVILDGSAAREDVAAAVVAAVEARFASSATP